MRVPACAGTSGGFLQRLSLAPSSHIRRRASLPRFPARSPPWKPSSGRSPRRCPPPTTTASRRARCAKTSAATWRSTACCLKSSSAGKRSKPSRTARDGLAPPRLIQDLSALELAYCMAVLLLNFVLRGSLGFGGALGLPLLALVLPVKVLAPAWSLVGIVSSAAIVGAQRKHVDRAQFLGLVPGCALGIVAGLLVFKALDTVLLARLLGGFIMLYAAYSLWKPRLAGPPAILKPLASFFSGAVGTIFGSMASIFFAMY